MKLGHLIEQISVGPISSLVVSRFRGEKADLCQLNSPCLQEFSSWTLLSRRVCLSGATTETGSHLRPCRGVLTRHLHLRGAKTAERLHLRTVTMSRRGIRPLEETMAKIVRGTPFSRISSTGRRPLQHLPPGRVPRHPHQHHHRHRHVGRTSNFHCKRFCTGFAASG